MGNELTLACLPPKGSHPKFPCHCKAFTGHLCVPELVLVRSHKLKGAAIGREYQWAAISYITIAMKWNQ